MYQRIIYQILLKAFFFFSEKSSSAENLQGQNGSSFSPDQPRNINSRIKQHIQLFQISGQTSAATAGI